VAIGPVHHEAPRPPFTQVKHLERVAKTLRPPPTREMIRIAERLKHNLTRRVEHPLAHKLRINATHNSILIHPIISLSHPPSPSARSLLRPSGPMPSAL